MAIFQLRCSDKRLDQQAADAVLTEVCSRIIRKLGDYNAVLVGPPSPGMKGECTLSINPTLDEAPTAAAIQEVLIEFNATNADNLTVVGEKL